MKKLFLILLVIPFVFLSSCKADEPEEPFTADFEITSRDTSPTVVISDSGYIGETRVFDSDAIDFSELESFFRQSLFTSDESLLPLSADTVTVALTGNYTKEDIDSLSAVCDMLNSVPSFVGIREVLPTKAAFTVNFSDTENIVINYNPYGEISGAEISIPHSLSAEERSAVLNTSILRICGFVNKCETTLDSAVNKAEPSSAVTDTDLLCIDILYSVGETGMTCEDFINAVKKYLL